MQRRVDESKDFRPGSVHKRLSLVFGHPGMEIFNFLFGYLSDFGSGSFIVVFFYLNTSSICRFTATLELENCLRIKNDYFDDCCANAVRCNLF